MILFKYKLVKAREIHQDMKTLIKTCQEYTGYTDPWEVFWDTFWELSREFPFSVDWCDMDMSYERDIMDRYNAIDNFMEGLSDDD